MQIYASKSLRSVTHSKSSLEQEFSGLWAAQMALNISANVTTRK